MTGWDVSSPDSVKRSYDELILNELFEMYSSCGNDYLRRYVPHHWSCFQENLEYKLKWGVGH